MKRPIKRWLYVSRILVAIQTLPAPLAAIFDSIDPDYHHKIDDAVRLGIGVYQALGRCAENLKYAAKDN